MHNQNGRLNTGTTVVAKLTFVPTMRSHPHQYGVRLRGLVVLCQCVLEGSYEFVGVKWRNAVIMQGNLDQSSTADMVLTTHVSCQKGQGASCRQAAGKGCQIPPFALDRSKADLINCGHQCSAFIPPPLTTTPSNTKSFKQSSKVCQQDGTTVQYNMDIITPKLFQKFKQSQMHREVADTCANRL